MENICPPIGAIKNKKLIYPNNCSFFENIINENTNSVNFTRIIFFNLNEKDKEFYSCKLYCK